jgi:hypothetical protein
MVAQFTIIGFIGSYQTITGLIDGGGMARMLGAVAAPNVKAALENLRALPVATDKKATVERATTQLETAFEAYLDSIIIVDNPLRAVASIFNASQQARQFEGLKLVTCCLAMCYTYHNDIARREKLLGRYQEWLARNNRDIDQATAIAGIVIGIPSFFANPSHWAEMAGEAGILGFKKPDEPVITIDMPEFIEQIKKVKPEPSFRLTPRIKVVQIKADTSQADKVTLTLKVQFYGYPFQQAKLGLRFTNSSDKWIAAPSGSVYRDADGDLYLGSFTETLPYMDTTVTQTWTIPLDQFPAGRTMMYPNATVSECGSDQVWLTYGRKQGASSITIKR